MDHKETEYPASAAILALVTPTCSSFADIEAAKKRIHSELQPSRLSKNYQIKELKWFIDTTEPFKGEEFNALSEGIPTHDHELRVLTKAFEAITGVKGNHQSAPVSRWQSMR
jgi:glycerol transport system substrate-binding protein